MKTVVIDWSTINDMDSFYSSIFLQTDAPSWHGRNLDAIQDSWVTGDISSDGPPFNFIFRHTSEVESDLRDFSETIFKIAVKSVKTNGGEIIRGN